MEKQISPLECLGTARKITTLSSESCPIVINFRLIRRMARKARLSRKIAHAMLCRGTRLIDPKTFPDWCRSRNLNADAEARTRFANLLPGNMPLNIAATEKPVLIVDMTITPTPLPRIYLDLGASWPPLCQSSDAYRFWLMGLRSLSTTSL